MTTPEVSSQLSKTELHIVPHTGPIKDDAQSPQSLVSRHRALSATKPVDPKMLMETQQCNQSSLDPRTTRIHGGARTPGSLAAEIEGQSQPQTQIQPPEQPLTQDDIQEPLQK